MKDSRETLEPPLVEAQAGSSQDGTVLLFEDLNWDAGGNSYFERVEAVVARLSCSI